MTEIVGADGGRYEVPEEKVADLLASGQFSTPQAAPAPDAAAPPAEGAGAGVASEAENPEAERQRLQAEKEAHAHDAPDIQDIPLIGEDGALYSVPDDKVQGLVATGKFRVSTLEERNAIADARRAAETERAGGTGLKPYVGGAVDAALTGLGAHNPIMGISEAASSPETQQSIEKLKEDVSDAHPVAYGAGAVGGEVGSALLAGAAAGGVTKALGATGIARAATEGAVYSAEPVAKAVLNKDPAGTAEAFVLGVGLNVALHGAFKAVEALPGLAAEGVEKAQGGLRSKFVPAYTEEEAENLVGRKSGLTTKDIAENRGKIGPAFKLAGITAEDFAEGRHIAKLQALDASGPAIGKAIKELDALAEKAPIIDGHLQEAQSQVRALLPPEVLEHEAASASMKAGQMALKEASSSSERLAARGVVSEAEARLAAVGKLSPFAEQAAKTLDPFIRQIDAAILDGSFGGKQGTQVLKRFLAEQTNFADNKFANSLRKQAGKIVSENIFKAEDAVGEQLGSAAVVEGLRKQRALYAISSLFGDAADKVAARAQPEQLGHLLGGPATGSGHMLPHFVLHALGLPSGINAAIAVTGVPQMVKHYVEKQQLRGAAAKLLNESTAPATSTLVHALERQKLELSASVKSFFAALGTREAEKPLDTTGGLRGFVPDANGRSHAQQLEIVQRLVTQAQIDPAAVAARLDHVVAPLRAEGLDDVAQAYTDHQLRLLKVLEAIVPHDPSSIARAHPFAAQVHESEIGPAAKERLQRALTVAADPRALLTLIHTNRITTGDVAIAAAVNPSTLQKLRDELVSEGMKSRPDLSYQQRLSMGILLGQHIDQSTEQIPQLQAAYAGVTSAMTGPAPHKSGKLSSGSGKSLANAGLTLSQHGHSR